MRADIAGGGRSDLVLVYSHLDHSSAAYPGGPSVWKTYFGASDATLAVVLADGHRVSTPISTGANGRNHRVRVAALIAVKHVDDDPGDEIFLEVSHISSGSNAVAYGLKDGRLVPAGVLLSYGGDSGSQGGFDCQAAAEPPELVQRVFLFGSPGVRARWKETELTYAWHGPKLLKIASRTFGENGNPSGREIAIGAGCGPVGSANPHANP
jgi:hypothetical protein